MKVSTTAVLAAALPLVLAGLEDAKFSTALTPQNFDSCGHCKSLEPVWTKIAQAFEGDDRCKVAHLNADDADARPIAQRYGVSGYPTIKFLAPPSKGGSAEPYQGARSEDAFLAFLNEKCGTDKLAGGLLSDLAGRIPSLDQLAALYLAPTATRPALLASASAVAQSLAGDSKSRLADYYLRVMAKFADASDSDAVQAAREWVDKERARLGKLVGKKGQVAVQKLEEAKMKQNILAAFASVQASASSLSSEASATVSSASSVASASASSLSSGASSVLSSATDAASSLGSEATKSAQSAYGEAAQQAQQASKVAGSVAGQAKETVVSAAQKVKDEL
ncbi:hypothetical protein Rhopal_007295-T1 [Rhodotorula paludigena]|uniref:protein disulfide-isomerase n=1 Tax=Rhodotorula paludigena TaxID=86838 RepID=A0AAV5GPC4_9BASI|nr:hypothetical protein Rhopal_007295-T1 [Rhodotorula paludigena]